MNDITKYMIDDLEITSADSNEIVLEVCIPLDRNHYRNVSINIQDVIVMAKHFGLIDACKVAQLPIGEVTMSMCEHKGFVVVASQKNIYILTEMGTNNWKLKRVEFIDE